MSEKFATDINVGDTIYRQEAIDEVINLWADKPFGNPTLVEIKDCIEALPPAQQQRILYANMSDAEFEKWLYEHGICNPNIHESIPCAAVPLLIDNAISELPSAQPERKTGKWLDGKGNVKIVGYGAYCSCCKRESEYVTNYCPNCGADMRTEGNDDN